MIYNKAVYELFFDDPDVNTTDYSNSSSDEIKSYVTQRYSNFFKSLPPSELIPDMCNCVVDFNNRKNKSIEDAGECLKRYPSIIKTTTDRIGEGEFGLYLLIVDSDKLGENEKGDLKIRDKKYEIKKYNGGTILFGTNIKLKSISSIRSVILKFNECLNTEDYYNHSQVKFFLDEYNKIIDGSDASITINKLKKLYDLFNVITECSKSQESSEEKNYKIIKISNNTEFSYYKILNTDLDNNNNTPKLEKINIRSKSDILNLFLNEIIDTIKSSMQFYPNLKIYAAKFKKELSDFYKKNKITIILIDKNNNFILDPIFEFHRISQSARPEVSYKSKQKNYPVKSS
jgi:hypothetical protein